MDLAGYVALTRQSGLAKELQSVANNIANLSTTGYRREGVIFAEEVQALPVEGGSVAMTEARARYTDEPAGVAARRPAATSTSRSRATGYFTVMTPQGERLTRAGAFTRNADGVIVNMDGHPLLDEGGGEITIPFEAKASASPPTAPSRSTARPRRGSASSTSPTRPSSSARRASSSAPTPSTVPVEDGRIVQGFLEQSNVNPVAEMARMVEVQRAYEYGQKLMDQEDERIRLVVRTLGQQA